MKKKCWNLVWLEKENKAIKDRIIGDIRNLFEYEGRLVRVVRVVRVVKSSK